MSTMMKVALASGSAAVAAYWWWLRRRQQRKALEVDNFQAAFPTAQWVSAMRAADAELDNPMIGSNIGGKPDTLARVLAGSEGEAIFQKGRSMGQGNGVSGLQDRSMKLDAHVMAALDDGVTQLVILAAGLDARAWRLPRMSKGVTVFEVDVPAAFEFKAARLKDLSNPEPPCTRVTVEADLSDANWPSKLVSAGFDDTKRSVFLIEGLLMYLPSGAPEQLLNGVGKLMTPGSVLTGDTFINLVSIVDQKFVRSLGTKWTFDFKSHEALRAQLTASGLDVAKIAGVGKIGGAEVPAAGDEKAADAAARRMQTHLLSLKAWPAAIHALVLDGIQKGDDSAKAFVSSCVDDKLNTQNLRDASAGVRARILELVISLPLEKETHGTTNFLAALRAEADQIAQSRPAKPFYRKWYEKYAAIRMIMKWKNAGTMEYVVYAARKA